MTIRDVEDDGSRRALSAVDPSRRLDRALGALRVACSRPRRRIPRDARALDATRNALRIERLVDRLATDGPMEVCACVVRRGGQLAAYTLADASVLQLHLFWARWEAVTQLDSIRWDDRVGWVVVVHTQRGDRRVDFAWLATVTAPDDARAGRHGSMRRVS